jgi:acetyltransferase-like isoleucine patch superfamily enzyme
MVRTAAARASANLGSQARVLSGGNIYNIRKMRDAIQVGQNSLIAGDLLTFAHGGQIKIGAWCYVGAGSRIWSAASIEIGDRVLISHGVNIHDSDSHPKDPSERHLQFVQIATTGHPQSIESIAASPICIEEDVWIGFNVTIMKGVRVGARSIVAAGSTLTKSVAPDSIVIGGEVRRVES